MRKQLFRVGHAGVVLVLGILTLASGLSSAAAGSGSSPEVSRVSLIEPRAVFQVFGENLEHSEIHIWQPETGEDRPALGHPTLPESPPQSALRITPLLRHGRVMYAESGRLRGTAVLWLENGSGLSKPRCVNRPELWNQSAERAMPGERFQIFGQNLHFKYTGRPWCVLKNIETGREYEAVWGPVQTQGMPYQKPFKMEVMMPKDIPHGEYELFVHNGTGGVYGWSDPVPVEILDERDLIGMASMAWNRLNLEVGAQEMDDIRVKRIDRDLGDGLSDATDAIQAAIDDLAKAGGGIVSLPPGTFGITRTLTLRPGVILKGGGRGATTLTVPFGKRLRPEWQEFRQPPGVGNTPLLWIQTEAGIEDMSLTGGPGAGGIVYIRNPEDRVTRRVFFNRVNVDNGGRRHLLQDGNYRAQSHGIRLFDFESAEFTMWNCTVKAPDPVLLIANQNRHVRLIGNTFVDSPRQTSNVVFIRGLCDSMITQNTFQSGRRSFVVQGGCWRNWLFQNRSSDVGRGVNGHEEFMSEGGSSCWTGHAEAIDQNLVALKENLLKRPAVEREFTKAELYLCVVSGRGFGQYRRVADMKDDKLLVGVAWDVEPDEHSKLALTRASVKNLWVNNTTGPGSGISQFVYGSGIENIIAGHQMLNDAQLSLFARGADFDEDGRVNKMGVLAFNQVLGCQSRFSGGHNSALHVWSRIGGQQFYTGRPYTVFGNTIRDNTVAGSSEGAQFKNQFGGWYWQVPEGDRMFFDPDRTSGIEINGGYNLVDNNFVIGMPVGIRVVGDGEGNYVHKNRIDDARIEVLDETGRSVVTPPERQDYGATVPKE
jgi:hypothetical protein